MNKSLTSFANKQLRSIHIYSRQYNELIGKAHLETLLRLMKEHVEEIIQRQKRKDKHYIIEIGDLLILCFELLKESHSSPDSILDKCYKRYHEKLLNLIGRVKKNGSKYSKRNRE